MFILRFNSDDSDFVSQGQGVAVRAQPDERLFFAVGTNQRVHAAHLGAVKSLESLLDLGLGGAECAQEHLRY